MYALILNKARMLRASAGTALAVAAGSVLAAVPESVSTELTTASADTKTIAGMAFAIALGIVVFKYFRRAL